MRLKSIFKTLQKLTRFFCQYLYSSRLITLFTLFYYIRKDYQAIQKVLQFHNSVISTV